MTMALTMVPPSLSESDDALASIKFVGRRVGPEVGEVVGTGVVGTAVGAAVGESVGSRAFEVDYSLS